MDRGVKIVLACGVLLGGIGLAMLFRRTPPRPSPKPTSQDRLLLRQQDGAEEAGPAIADRLTARIESQEDSPPPPEASRRSIADHLGGDPGEPPPVLARSYPPFSDDEAFSGASSTPAERPNAERSARAAWTHKIVDGDTLRGLAERYLGDADRYLEIYEANAEVLPSPEVLPIGVELKIPPRGGARSGVHRGPQRPLVPVLPPSHVSQ